MDWPPAASSAQRPGPGGGQGNGVEAAGSPAVLRLGPHERVPGPRARSARATDAARSHRGSGDRGGGGVSTAHPASWGAGWTSGSL